MAAPSSEFLNAVTQGA